MKIVQTRILLRLGPLAYHTFQSFLPADSVSGGSAEIGTQHHRLRELVRSFVGPETEIEVELQLDPRQSPECRAGNSRLGWNAWLGSAPSSVTAQQTLKRSVSFIIRDL